jgi:hypothetical protein
VNNHLAVWDGTSGDSIKDGGALNINDTWTPELMFGGDNTGITYNFRQGDYWKVGQLVMASFSLQLTSKGSAVGDATLGGFSLIGGSYLVFSSGITVPGGGNGTLVANVGSTFSLFAVNTAGGFGTALNNTNFSNGTVIGIPN